MRTLFVIEVRVVDKFCCIDSIDFGFLFLFVQEFFFFLKNFNANPFSMCRDLIYRSLLEGIKISVRILL